MSLILQGSAVIWFNLLKSGEEDTRTLHAACPVFVGNKWGKFPLKHLCIKCLAYLGNFGKILNLTKICKQNECS